MIASMDEETRSRGAGGDALALAARAGRATNRGLTRLLGGEERTRVIVLLACVLGLAGADNATVGASATALGADLHITNTDIGLLVTVTALVGALASLPFGVLADRVRRTTVLGLSIFLWAAAMLWSALVPNFHELLLSRLALGAVVAAAGPLSASLIGDWFAASERGRIYGFILGGEFLGAGFGFAVTGDIASLISWRAAFVILALLAVVLGWFVLRLKEPARGGRGVLARDGEVETEPLLELDEDAPRETDAQRLARVRGVLPHEDQLDGRGFQKASLLRATKYVLRVRTNLLLIAATACGYYFLAGIQTFGMQFATKQYGIDQALANLLLLAVGAGAVAGVVLGGNLGDWLLGKGYLTGRITTAVIGAAGTTLIFIPALVTSSAFTALPYLVVAVAFLSVQNPTIAASQLDIIPPSLWGRAEAIRTMLRSVAMALAPLLFGAVSDHVFGGGRSGLQWTFIVMLVPLAASVWLLFKARQSYPQDVATAAAAASSHLGRSAGEHW
jgi:MFS family permease